jgi:Tfp pilus assembly protein PilO
MNFPNRRAPGHVQVELGAMQRIVIGVMLTALVSLSAYAGKRILDELDSLGKQQTAFAQQQAVMQQQLATITLQLADIPGIRQQLAEMTGQVNRNKDDIKDLKGARGR